MKLLPERLALVLAYQDLKREHDRLALQSKLATQVLNYDLSDIPVEPPREVDARIWAFKLLNDLEEP